MKSRRLLSIIILVLFCNSLTAQNNPDEVSILFYNVENLFDVIDNPDTEDDNYTPQGDLHWTSKKLDNKVLNISKVVLSASGWNVPVIVGLCEIENQFVLDKLVKDTPLKSIPYKIIHKESPDHRGIDVAMLYNATHFYPLEYQYHPLINDKNEIIKTREILYVKGILNELDTVHIFINHWPSRFSGLLETKEQRKIAAQTLHAKVDELVAKSYKPKIIILGDFNDNPTDESILETLMATPVNNNIVSSELYNLSANWLSQETGTLKYQSQWYFFDQVIVSGSLLMAKSGYKTSVTNATKADLQFLLEKDEKYGGIKPKRTYYGYSYNGGFSDHLPVLLKLIRIN